MLVEQKKTEMSRLQVRVAEVISNIVEPFIVNPTFDNSPHSLIPQNITVKEVARKLKVDPSVITNNITLDNKGNNSGGMLYQDNEGRTWDIRTRSEERKSSRYKKAKRIAGKRETGPKIRTENAVRNRFRAESRRIVATYKKYQPKLEMYAA